MSCRQAHIVKVVAPFKESQPDNIVITLDNQSTALAILSAGRDIMKTNADGFRPIDCTMNTKFQFEIKRAPGNRDIMIS
jgi:hypothetical protein